MRIKHLLVNWALEDEELLEPYEWEEDDDLEILRSALLIHVSQATLQVLFSGIIRMTNCVAGDYLFSDGHTSLACRLDASGQLVCRSVLPFEYRSAIATMAATQPIKIIQYELQAQAEPKEYGLSREEKEKKQWLLDHIERLDQAQLKVLYELALPLATTVHFDDLASRLEHGYGALHQYLYEQFVTQKRLT